MQIEKRDIIEIVGITAVVISLIFVGYELQQTQKAMLAESSNVRAQMAIDRNMADFQYGSIAAKARNGESLTEDERNRARVRNNVFLRYLENLHYQWELGLLDEEIWEANLWGLTGLVNDSILEITHPGFYESTANVYRASFIELAKSLREDQ